MSNTLICCRCERKFNFTIKQVNIHFHQKPGTMACTRRSIVSMREAATRTLEELDHAIRLYESTGRELYEQKHHLEGHARDSSQTL